jgi:two-component sensor histidine kinase
VIEAILRQTANKSLSTNDFVARFSARVQSLAQSHDLLVDEDWQRASIFDIVRSQLSPYSDLQGPQIQLSGEAMYVRPDASQHIGMALHELATNATKYGALSVPEGRVQVQWGRSPDQATCFLSWREENGPEVQPPSKAGFGRVMIERAIARAVGGTVKLQYPPSGIEWTLTFPVGILI